MKLGRRSFLRHSLTMAGAGLVLPGVTVRGLLAPRTAWAAPGTKHLVLLRLYGGNDGLNTVIPYGMGAYYDARPRLAVQPGDVVAIDGTMGLHPRLLPLKAHLDAKRLAIIQAVGYPDHSLSHFRSEVIWQMADPYGLPTTGWIGRWLDTLSPPGDTAVRGVDVGYSLDPVLYTERASVFATPSLDALSFPTDDEHKTDAPRKRATFEAISSQPRAGRLAQTLAARGFVVSRNVDLYAGLPRTLATEFPDTNLAQGFATVAQMIAASQADTIAAGVYQVGIDGFDTHANQDDPGAHPDLLGEIADALHAFHGELTARGLADDVLVLAYSEFGRRVEENGSRGTDHGTSAPMFAFGNAVQGGVYGPNPDFTDLDEDGDFRFQVDFREVYATVLERWLGADSTAILGQSFTPVPFLAA